MARSTASSEGVASQARARARRAHGDRVREAGERVERGVGSTRLDLDLGEHGGGRSVVRELREVRPRLGQRGLVPRGPEQAQETLAGADQRAPALRPVRGHEQVERRGLAPAAGAFALRAAAKDGYVPGGGVALLRTQEAIKAAQKKAKNEDEKYGFDIVAKAVEAPIKQIAENAGFDGDLVIENVKEGKGANHGFNAATGEYVDLVKAGIIDAALVAKTALVNAASVAGLMLTTDVIITELKEDAKVVEGAVS